MPNFTNSYSHNSYAKSWCFAITRLVITRLIIACAVVLLSMPTQLFAPDHDPQAAQNLGAQHASQAHAHDSEQRDSQENLPAGISFYLPSYSGVRTPVLGADRRVLKFIYLGPGLVQEDGY
jgi:hypothetical protein